MLQPLTSEYILSFLEENRLGVLSTVNAEGHPDGAAIYFIVKPDFTAYFVTPTGTQRHTNLQHMNEVVLTVINEEKRETAHIRAIASDAKDMLFEVIGNLATYLNEKSGTTVNTELPLLSYKDRPKTVIQLTPIEVGLRRFSSNHLEEEKIVL